MDKNPGGIGYNRALFSEIKQVIEQFQIKMCNLLNIAIQN